MNAEKIEDIRKYIFRFMSLAGSLKTERQEENNELYESLVDSVEVIFDELIAYLSAPDDGIERVERFMKDNDSAIIASGGEDFTVRTGIHCSNHRYFRGPTILAAIDAAEKKMKEEK